MVAIALVSAGAMGNLIDRLRVMSSAWWTSSTSGRRVPLAHLQRRRHGSERTGCLPAFVLWNCGPTPCPTARSAPVAPSAGERSPTTGVRPVGRRAVGVMAPPSRAPLRRGGAGFWALLLSVVTLDVVTKTWAVGALMPRHVPHEIIGEYLRFTLSEQSGRRLRHVRGGELALVLWRVGPRDHRGDPAHHARARGRVVPGI